MPVSLLYRRDAAGREAGMGAAGTAGISGVTGGSDILGASGAVGAEASTSAPPPVLLYGYGSYGECVDVGWDIDRIAVADAGVTHALCHVRRYNILHYTSIEPRMYT